MKNRFAAFVSAAVFAASVAVFADLPAPESAALATGSTVPAPESAISAPESAALAPESAAVAPESAAVPAPDGPELCPGGICPIPEDLFGSGDAEPSASSPASSSSPSASSASPSAGAPAPFSLVLADGTVLPTLDGFEVVRTQAGDPGAEDFVAFLRGGAPDESAFDSALRRGGVPLLAAALVFAGLLLNLTPCTLPLVPVNLALLGVGAGRSSRGRGALVGAAFADREVGFDLERVRPVPARTAKAFCTDADRRYIFGETPAPETLTDSALLRRFFEVWTCKEALAKLTGEGFTERLRTVDLDPAAAFEYPPGFVVCTLTAGGSGQEFIAPR